MIRGYCLGGGMNIAVLCDLRIAADDARFGIPAAKMGLGYRASSMKNLVDVVGAAYAREIMITARQFTAAEAKEMGLVNKVVSVAELEKTVARIQQTISGNAPLTMRTAKRIIREIGRGRLRRREVQGLGARNASRARTTRRPQGLHGEAQTRFHREVKMRYVLALLAAAVFGSRYSRRPFRPSRSPWWWASSPAAAPTPWRGSSPSSWPSNIGQQVVVENRAGAGGNIAVDYTIKSAPDGYTMVLANVGALTVNPHLMKLGYDPLQRPRAGHHGGGVPQHHRDAADGQREDAGRLRAAREGEARTPSPTAPPASAAPGTWPARCSSMMAHIQLVHVPYKGGGPAMRGLVGGEIDSYISTPVAAMPHIQSGRVFAIATTGARALQRAARTCRPSPSRAIPATRR